MRLACKWMGATWLGVALLASGTATAWAAPQAAAAQGTTQAPATGYSRAEYDAYNAAHLEKDPATKIKDLDDFVAKNPNAYGLMVYVYRDYYLTYYQLKNYAQAIAYADKELELGDKVDFGTRVEAEVARAQAFSFGGADKSLQTPDQLTKARAAANDGLKMLDTWKKPDNTTDDDFAKVKKNQALVFDTVIGTASTGLKDYKGAQAAYKSLLALSPDDAITHYHLGVSYLQDTPPDITDGYWELSRALALKVPGDTQIMAYLKNQLLHYQQLSCDGPVAGPPPLQLPKLADDEINQWVTLAGSTNDKPATLSIPSADDLAKARDDTANFIPWLQEGGDHGHTMWLATCGLEYPDVVVSVQSVTPGDGDNVTLDVYRPSAADPDAAAKEMESATAPNMELHVVGQPEAKKLNKDDELRFTGTITAYTQSPFMLTWDNVKINADDLKDLLSAPAGAPGTPKKPGAAKAPAKKP